MASAWSNRTIAFARLPCRRYSSPIVPNPGVARKLLEDLLKARDRFVVFAGPSQRASEIVTRGFRNPLANEQRHGTARSLGVAALRDQRRAQQVASLRMAPPDANRPSIMGTAPAGSSRASLIAQFGSKRRSRPDIFQGDGASGFLQLHTPVASNAHHVRFGRNLKPEASRVRKNRGPAGEVNGLPVTIGASASGFQSGMRISHLRWPLGSVA